MKPILIEVIAYAPTQFYHCQHCEVVFKEHGIGDKIHAEQLRSSMPADLLRDYANVSRWVKAMFDRYGEQIVVKVIDAASLEGFFKAVRYGLRKFPAVVVNHKEKYSGADLAQAEPLIQRQLSMQTA